MHKVFTKKVVKNEAMSLLLRIVAKRPLLRSLPPRMFHVALGQENAI